MPSMPLTIIASTALGGNPPRSLLRTFAGPTTIADIDVIGDPAALDLPLLGLFSSVRCPGDAILRAYDLARELRDAGVPTVGGFHSPMEKECLDLLLRGRQPVVVCPARSLTAMRIPAAWRPAIADGRLTVVSPFDARHRRVTADLAAQRNELVAALSTALLVLHAAPGGQVEHLAQAALAESTPVFVAVPERAQDLVATGAAPATTAAMQSALAPSR
jgi:predicted Rossmann fold nucleotide-binding protein DprA/Smf involved in DNA uptake